MTMLEIIEKKKNAKTLSKEEIEFFVNGYTENKIPDYQASSLLMAITINGMNMQETTDLTTVMAKSGDILDLSSIHGVIVDKHSTGGVGDKTTLIVAPIVASLGCKVAKMSGRGLGFTGGTADKLESIEGYNLFLSEEEFINQVNKIGISLISQTKNLAPADKKLYSLRDVTGTVVSIPLIASSIMSKKIASGADCIVLDVKVGNGAFMKDLKQAKELSQTMVTIGKMVGRKTIAIITDMNEPLGNNIGNNLEVKEAIEVLNGRGPQDLVEVSIELATKMLMMCSNEPEETCKNKVKQAIDSKQALDKFCELVKAQGGNEDYIKNPDLFEKSKYAVEVKAQKQGYINKINTELIGKISGALGAGRQTKEDKIDYSAGIIMNKKTGDYIEKGEVLAILYTNKEEIIEEALDMYEKAITILDAKPEKLTTIYEIVI